MDELCGIINIYKEKGYTSHDVVNIVRKKLNRVKTGHTGTLDPDACGVLPICIGKATKTAEYIASDIKRYMAVLTLGAFTTTQDISGEIIQSFDVNCNENEIINAVESFRGDILQTPPMYSAIKINGKKLYELAREGKTIERKKRKVTIYDIRVLEFKDKRNIVIDVICSKGTYIRTLCNDIGEKLGCGGFMSELTRTRTGNFYIEDSIKLAEFSEKADLGKIEDILMPIEDVMPDMKKAKAASAADKYVINGNKINLSYLDRKDIDDGENFFVYKNDGKLVGIYKKENEFAKPVTMLM
ncbi:MAG: tRNA pseudouridine(55) synthase TruB [Firmicutes bacterium]|nr:tRNA pseudouridine(55) synthase TruB [Bacillota bacterium]